MQLKTIARILGLLLAIFSLSLIPPLVLAVIYGDGETVTFAAAFIATLFSGVFLWWPFRRERKELRVRDGFLVVVLFWTVLGLFGALPFYWASSVELSFASAAFESFSGLTTTGGTVITGLDTLPHALLYYRQQLQWFGGMGIIVLAVAIMPMLGVGGMQLYKAETPGPVKDSKLTPRIAGTAKALWKIYLGITIMCALLYWAAGMSLFDAIGHSFSTVSTGGLSTHDASIGYFNSSTINLIAVIFMFLGATNFSLHFLAVQSFARGEFPKKIPYMKDPEFRTYFYFYLFVTILVGTILFVHHQYENVLGDFEQSLFHVISIGTSTGFSIDTFQAWPGMLPMFLMLTSFVGGCGGSTGGGMKVMRILLLVKQGWREVQRLIHPNGVFLIKLGSRAVPEKVVESVWGFFATFIALFLLMMLLLLADGLDVVSAFTAVTACINNMGPGLNKVAAHYKDVSDFGKWVLSLAMLMGRLEIFSLLVLFSPAFWRK